MSLRVLNHCYEAARSHVQYHLTVWSEEDITDKNSGLDLQALKTITKDKCLDKNRSECKTKIIAFRIRHL